MRRLALVPLAALACRDHRPPAAAPSPVDAAAPAVDATPPIDALPADAPPPVPADEAARRLGQDPGLAPDRHAAVATEPLIVALATGHASLGAYLDPPHGVVEVTFDDRGAAHPTPRCGAAARDTAATYVGRSVDRQMAGAPLLLCDNAFAAAPPSAAHPRAALGRHATCRSPGSGDGDGDGLVLVADADGGLRVRAVLALRGAAPTDAAWRVIGRAVARARCP